MSSATKAKSKDKKSSKDAASSKPSGSANISNGIPTSGYNPLSGTFHNLETAAALSPSSLNINVRFRNIDETDVGGLEYDLVSNNDSWSGESEDHREKTSNHSIRQETVPGADMDKREKIRLKNEKKHQRQKEKRAQELHEKCSGYLMSRKLDELAQQLGAMGFSQERATMALMLNEGKVNESVAWLIEAGEISEMSKDPIPGNLKIDITEELSRIGDMEIRYKCTKQEVEKAIVAAEGDIEKAREALGAPKQDPPKLDEIDDPPSSSYGKLLVGTASQNSQLKPGPSPAVQHIRDDKDFNYTKASAIMGDSSESISKSVPLPSMRTQQKLDWPIPQQNAAMVAEKLWTSAGSNPSSSYPLPLSPPAYEFKNLHHPSIREPVMMMQRPQAIKTEPVPATSISSSHGIAANWYPTTNDEIMNSKGLMTHNPISRSLNPNDLSSTQMYQRQLYYQQQQHQQQRRLGDMAAQGNGHWSRNGASPTIAAASSLGLFSRSGSSSVDWTTGGSLGLDYSSIDWTLDRSLSYPRSDRSWTGSNFDLYNKGVSSRHDIRPGVYNNKGVSFKPVYSSNGVDSGLVANTESSSAREWTSPFEENDIFSVPGKFVYRPL